MSKITVCISICSYLLLVTAVFAQNSTTDPTLFTFGNEAVTKSEFLYVYDKHNANDDNRYTKASIDEYLDLYVNFKLKVKEAESLGIDTIPAIEKQLEEYYSQLAQSYLYDKEVSDELIREAYDRMTKEVKTSHLLIMCSPDALPADTLKAYNKVLNIYNTYTTKESDFSKLATKYSQDPSVKDNKGDLGYLTAFQTVYPFETAMYNTPVGTVSKPVRSKFGYHLVKVDDVRPASGKIRVAHILIKADKKDTPEQIAAKESKIKALYKQAKRKKVAFETLARNESDDRQTARKGGELDGWFGTGRLYPAFETAAFAIKKNNAISKPVKTELGWHIIKLLDKQKIGSFEDEKDLITTKIEKDGRSQITQQAFIKRLKTSYQYQDNAPYLRAFTKKVNKMVLFGKWRADSIKNDALDKILFTVNMPKGDLQKPELVKTNFTEADFAAYIEKNQKRAKTKAVELTVNRLFNNFVEGILIKAEEKMLPVKNPDFGRLVKEFRDGNLLYELMGERVWNKAMQDTIGLQAFYDKNKNNYLWPQRLDATIINCPNEALAKQTREQINAGENAKALEKSLKDKGGVTNIRIDSDLYAKDQNKVIDKIEWKAGLSENVSNNDGSVSFVQVYGIVEPSPKKLSEARGYVIADYQTELEKAWITELREKYPVEIDNGVLKTLYKR